MMRFAAICIMTWLAGTAVLSAQESASAQVERGRAVYQYWCATCHGPGAGMPGTQALAAKYDGALPAVLTERADLTSEFVAVIVRTGISVMPPFRKTEITDAELAAIGEYIEATARGE